MESTELALVIGSFEDGRAYLRFPVLGVFLIVYWHVFWVVGFSPSHTYLTSLPSWMIFMDS